VTEAEALGERGFVLVPRLLDAAAVGELAARTEGLLEGRAGSRALLEQPWCAALAVELLARLGPLGLLGPRARPLQCTLFEKSAETGNWFVPLHQDVAMPVAERHELPGWTAWSIKEGRWFAQPPADVLANLVAVRLHLDPCGPEDGPLRVVPGSHHAGVLPEPDVFALKGQELECPAEPGDALLLKPLLVHSSGKAKGTSRRRVLHFLFEEEAAG
jgi:hypothetical protein